MDDAENTGKLKRDTVIIEPTSGNTCILVLLLLLRPEVSCHPCNAGHQSVERRQLMKAYGAELVLSDGKKGMKGAIAKAEELAKEIANSFIPGQFINPANPKAHREHRT